jgi:hypothetical protein
MERRRRRKKKQTRKESKVSRNQAEARKARENQGMKKKQVNKCEHKETKVSSLTCSRIFSLPAKAKDSFLRLISTYHQRKKKERKETE